MHVNISVGETDMGGVVHDLSSARGGQIISLDDETSTIPSDTGFAGAIEKPLSIDPKLIYSPLDPYSSEMSGDLSSRSSTQLRQITARVPLREMVGYLRHLRSLTGGRGTFVMQVDRFEKVTGQRLGSILREIKNDTV